MLSGSSSPHCSISSGFSCLSCVHHHPISMVFISSDQKFLWQHSCADGSLQIFMCIWHIPSPRIHVFWSSSSTKWICFSQYSVHLHGKYQKGPSACLWSFLLGYANILQLFLSALIEYNHFVQVSLPLVPQLPYKRLLHSNTVISFLFFRDERAWPVLQLQCLAAPCFLVMFV